MINHLVYSLLEYSKDKITTGEVLSACVDSQNEIPIGFEAELESKIKKLKKLLFVKLYQHKDITRKMYAGKQAIKGLYKGLMEDEKMLPEFYYKQLQTRNKHRVIADYIASMSDRYAIKFYNEMYGKL
jgi:dGTPase